jgi:hypothetical protein
MHPTDLRNQKKCAYKRFWRNYGYVDFCTNWVFDDLLNISKQVKI